MKSAMESKRIYKRGILPGVESEEDEENEDILEEENTSSANGENDQERGNNLLALGAS